MVSAIILCATCNFIKSMKIIYLIYSILQNSHFAMLGVCMERVASLGGYYFTISTFRATP